VDTKLRAVELLFGGVHVKKIKRRNYTDEFKEEAVKLVTEQHYKVTEAARNIGIHHSLLRRWIKAESPESEPSIETTVQLKAELKRVKKENEQLRMEREILKKAAAFFAKESA
jgi:transposase